MSPRRGEVWLVEFGDPFGREQGYRRPAVLVSSDDLNHGPAGVVIVVPLTSASRGLPSHVELEPGDTGLNQISYAKAEDVRSLSAERLVHRLGVTPLVVVYELDEALRLVMELA